MKEKLEEIEKELEELERKKTELYRQRQMLFIKLKSAIDLLGEYVEFAEKQDIVTMINLLNEIEQVSKEINVILGFSKMWGRSEEMVSIQEIDEEIKWVVGEIERKTREKASIIERMKK